jgi:hypothetical protein
MALDTRTAQTTLENLLRDAVLYALGMRYPQLASIAALRAFPTMSDSGTMRDDNELITTLIGGATAGWRWNTASTAADNGTTVVQPNDVPVGGKGRWLAFTSQLRFSTVVGGNSMTLDQITSGPLQRVIVIDKELSKEEKTQLIEGAVPAVIIECHGDSPRDAGLDVGARWVTEYEFTISVLTQNLRDQRQAAQGSALDGDPGANAIDGFIKALLAGTVLNAAFVNDQPIMNVRLGDSENRYSEYGQRRVWRIRNYTLVVTEEFPMAPNDTTVPTDAFVQAELVALNSNTTYDPNDYLVSGCLPTVGAVLAQSVSAGTAVIAGNAVNYAGQSFTFAAYSDTYRDLKPNGTMTFTAVTASGLPPALTSGALRIGVTTTNGSVVVGDQVLAQTQANFGPDFDFPIS